MMSRSLKAARAELKVVVKNLEHLDTRDKICRAVQFGSKFLGAKDVEKTTSLARKVFRLFKFLSNVDGLIDPSATYDSLLIYFSEMAKNLFMGLFLFLDQFVWLAKTGIYHYKDKEIQELSTLFMLCGFTFTTIFEAAQIPEKRKLQSRHPAKDRPKPPRSVQIYLPPIKAFLDVIVAFGLLQTLWLADQTKPDLDNRLRVVAQITGGLGFTTSLMSIYLNSLLQPSVAEVIKDMAEKEKKAKKA